MVRDDGATLAARLGKWMMFVGCWCLTTGSLVAFFYLSLNGTLIILPKYTGYAAVAVIYSGCALAGIGAMILFHIQGRRFRILQNFWRDAISKLFLLLILLTVWFSGVTLTTLTILEKIVFLTEPVALSGTGSMRPTFAGKTDEFTLKQAEKITKTPQMLPYPAILKIGNRTLFEYRIGRGDIVSFFNRKTEQIARDLIGHPSGFVKRVIALSGDKVEIKGGILYLNGEPQKEQYTAAARSTFGGKFLSECEVLTIPEGKLFVMGDNRKASNDSRHELGLISYGDIDHVIPWKSQRGNWDKNWRDSDYDLEESRKIQLDIERYVTMLNKNRVRAGANELVYEPRLARSAEMRARVMLRTGDFSFEATG